MKPKSPLFKVCTAILTTSVFSSISAHAVTVFSFQQGDLRQDGNLFGSGASYSGTFAGSVSDQAPTTSVSSPAQFRVGNQFRATNTNVGTNGQQWSGLFTINLSELATFINNNPGYTVSEASFSLTRVSGTSNNSALSLYQTAAFTTSATWATIDGTNAWPAPLTANPGGAAGGGTVSSGPLNGNSVGTTNSTMTFGTSSSFVDAVEDALTRGDTTLYLLVQVNSGSSFDAHANYATTADATLDNRPELTITLIPEPTTALLGTLGLLALLRRRRA